MMVLDDSFFEMLLNSDLPEKLADQINRSLLSEAEQEAEQERRMEAEAAAAAAAAELAKEREKQRQRREEEVETTATDLVAPEKERKERRGSVAEPGGSKRSWRPSPTNPPSKPSSLNGVPPSHHNRFVIVLRYFKTRFVFRVSCCSLGNRYGDAGRGGRRRAAAAGTG